MSEELNGDVGEGLEGVSDQLEGEVEDSGELLSESEDLSAEEARELEYQEAMAKINPDYKKPSRKEKKANKKEEELPENNDEETIEESEESSDEVEDKEEAPKEEAPKEEKKPDIKKFKVKNKIKEVDMNDRKEVERLISQGLGARESFEDSAKIRKNAESFIKALQNDPMSVLSNPKLGINLREVSEEWLYNQYKYEKLSDEDRARVDRDRKLEEYERAEQIKKDNEVKQRKAQKVKAQRERWVNNLTNSLEKHGLPATSDNLEKVATRMKLAIKEGFTQVTPEDIIPSIKDEFLAQKKALLSGMDEDKLSEFLGEDVVAKIRRAEVRRFKEKTGAASNKISQRPRTKSTKTFNSMEDMIESIKGR